MRQVGEGSKPKRRRALAGVDRLLGLSSDTATNGTANSYWRIKKNEENREKICRHRPAFSTHSGRGGAIGLIEQEGERGLGMRRRVRKSLPSEVGRHVALVNQDPVVSNGSGALPAKREVTRGGVGIKPLQKKEGHPSEGNGKRLGELLALAPVSTKGGMKETRGDLQKSDAWGRQKNGVLFRRKGLDFDAHCASPSPITRRRRGNCPVMGGGRDAREYGNIKRKQMQKSIPTDAVMRRRRRALVLCLLGGCSFLGGGVHMPVKQKIGKNQAGDIGESDVRCGSLSKGLLAGLKVMGGRGGERGGRFSDRLGGEPEEDS